MDAKDDDPVGLTDGSAAGRRWLAQLFNWLAVLVLLSLGVLT
ncbi:MAG TPA: hypothetical protein VMC02_00975 [Steroidobacteraceae bacterium]|nr:hypothetical protein [Steroidobacteraceae bacterium]